MAPTSGFASCAMNGHSMTTRAQRARAIVLRAMPNWVARAMLRLCGGCLTPSAAMQSRTKIAAATDGYTKLPRKFGEE